MKILLISPEGDGMAVADRLALEGHEVKVYIKKAGFQKVGLGIVERVTSWRPEASGWADFVIGDMVGMGGTAHVLERFDVLHMGFNPLADMFELDRAKQRQLLRKAGCPMPDTFEYESPGAAREILTLWEEPGFVVKPSGNLNTGLTVVARERETLEWALEQFTGDQELIVQKIVEGIEVSTEGWFNGTSFIEPFNHTFEEKRFLPGAVGPNVGCMGNVVIRADPTSPLVQNVRRLEPWLRSIKYRGPLDLNTIVSEQRFWTLEATPRFGYDAIEALTALLEGSLKDLLWGTAMGTLEEMKLRKGDVGIAVRLSVPPYPHANPERGGDERPILVPENRREHALLTDVMKDGNVFRWAGADGVVAKVIASGRSVRAARQTVYEYVDEIRCEGLQYRTDIGERATDDIIKLGEWGMLRREASVEPIRRSVHNLNTSGAA